MPPYEIEIVNQTRSMLGEGPSWWASRSVLVRVDIAAGLVIVLDPATGTSESIAFDGEVSAAVPRVGGGMIVAMGHELISLDGDGNRDGSWSAETGVDDNRFNDCRVDPAGRLWAGTMSKSRTPDRAALYCLEPGASTLRTVISPTTLSNGMGWSPGGDRFYFVDSTTQRIEEMAFDPATGSIGDRTTFAVIDPADGLPDGLSVDTDGGVWLALFGGSAIRRYSPDGALDLHIPLPVTNPTCPAFGGPGLEILYVTSARIRLTEQQLAAEPAGALLALKTGHRGWAAPVFQG